MEDSPVRTSFLPPPPNADESHILSPSPANADEGHILSPSPAQRR